MIEKTETSKEHIEQKAKLRWNYVLRVTVDKGRKARDRKQDIKLNPFSAVTQPNLFAAWENGFIQRDAEIRDQAGTKATPAVKEEEQ